MDEPATPRPARVLAELASRAGLPEPAPDPLAAIDALDGWGLVLQDHRPLCEGLEWQLSRQVWLRQGARPFVEGGVPHVINNSGTLSRQCAALLLDSLQEQPAAGPVRLLEIGAGIGLFARLLLDELARRCADEGRDLYSRIEFHVTDLSPSAVAQWQQSGLFDGHDARVRLHACSAAEAAALPGRWHAVFANYVLDVLPAELLRRGAGGWERLHARCLLRADAAARRRASALPPAELRALGERADEAALDTLLPLVPLIESDTSFRPADPATLPPGLPDPAALTDGEVVTVNTAALQVLDTLLPRLAAGGWCLLSDYTSVPRGGDVAAQRFGPVTAIGLNLPALDVHVQRAGFDPLAAAAAGAHPLEHRLIGRDLGPRTRATYAAVFSAEARLWRDEPALEAREQAAAGRWDRALAAYREAAARAPGDWSLLAEIAAFAGTELADPELAARLAQAALAINPWTDVRAWSVLGEALAATGRHEQALTCHEQALRIHPRHAASWLGLARRRLALGRPAEALQAVAGGLACDADSTCRHLLLAEQEQALQDLASTWGAERAAAARRG